MMYSLRWLLVVFLAGVGGGCGDHPIRERCPEGLSLYFADQDSDGKGDDAIVVEACLPPDGFVVAGGDPEPDCATDDTDECGVCGGTGAHLYYEDLDGDGEGDPGRGVASCDRPQGFVTNADDVDPLCPQDNADECGVCGGSGAQRYFADQDGDGLGDEAVFVESCAQPDGFVRSAGDPEPNCATNNTDDCGACGGADRDKDCAGVCFGEATQDGCGVCVGGATGRDPSVVDADGDQIPDACDQCPADGMARFVVQWTEIAHASGIGGPYTFQVVLFENGDFVFNYRDVEPFEASLTLGYQSAPGLGASLDVNGDLAREVRSVYYRRTEDGSLALAPTEPYVWTDLRHAGEVLRLGDDGAADVAIGFPFSFGPGRHERTLISADGWLGFEGPFPEGLNTSLPNPDFGSFIAPFWDDLDPSRTRGSVRFLALERGCDQDCAGVFGGVARIDGCGDCVGGTTAAVPEAARDCDHQCDGLASVDVCGQCSGGDTGREPGVPEDCRQGPDLIVDQDYLRRTVMVEEMEVNDECLVAERCVRDVGMRTLLRFGTRIANIGNQDLRLGRPSEDLPFWHWDECHSHFHYLAYAAYEIHDVSTGERLPYGAKSGFSVIDIGVYDPELAPDGCVGYNGQDQGITAGCQDTYGRGLQCQWIDITGLADGTYDLVVTTNPDEEIEELNYQNNSAQVRVHLQGGAVRVIGRELRCADGVDEDGDGLIDCDDPDCEEICLLPPREPPVQCPVADLGTATGVGLMSGVELPVVDAQDGECAGQGRGEVGYRWTAPRDGRYLFHALGTSFDSSLYLRSGGCDGDVVECNQDNPALPGEGTPAVEADLRADDVVTVVLDGMLHEDGEYTVSIHPRDDACEGADLGAALGQVVEQGNSEGNATVLLAPCGRSAVQTVYRWRAPRAGRYQIDTFGSVFDTALFVLAGDCEGPDLGCNDDTNGLQSMIEIELEADQAITIVVGGFNGQAGEYVLNINRSALLEGPCPDIEALSATGVIHRGGAEERYARRHGTCGGGGREVLVSWVAPQDDQYLFHTMGTDGDPVLYALDGCAGDEWGCNHDQWGLGTVAGLTLDLERGHGVVLGVDDLPANDDVVLNAYGRRADCQSSPLPLALGERIAQGRNEDATTRLLATCGQLTGQVTFSWVAAVAGDYIFDSRGSDFDTALEVVRGRCGLESLGCNDDSGGLQSEVQVNLERGEEVTVILGGFRSARGAYVLNGRRADEVAPEEE